MQSVIKDNNRSNKLSAKDGGIKFPRPFTELRSEGLEVSFPRPSKGGIIGTSTRSLPLNKQLIEQRNRSENDETVHFINRSIFVQKFTQQFSEDYHYSML